MAESLPGRKFRISPIDSRGRIIAPEVLSVAYTISERALGHAEKAIGDPAVALSLLEETAATVSRVLNGQRQSGTGIRNLRAYLFRAYVRRVNRLRRRQLIAAEPLSDESRSTQKSNPREEVETTVLINELLAKCDPVTREMFRRRLDGHDWKAIGRKYGISAHAAESRFSQALKRLRKRLRLESGA